MEQSLRRCLLFWLCLSLSISAALAQSRDIRGKVTSSEDNKPIPGASVIVLGTARGTTADADGNYRIQANVGQTLRFSFIGNKLRDVVVGNAEVIDVTMQADDNQLNEVVVTALGVKQEKRALGYSVQEVKGNVIAETQRDNFLNALNGRVAGASITPTSGNPGASTSITLRGISSIGGNNQPLFVVDGLPIDNRTFNQGALVSDSPNRNNDYQNRGADINPNDIETLTILKGPEASALYGLDAASGAIVITTKKGSGAAGRGRITYDNAFRFEDVYRFPAYQKTYGPGDNGTFSTPTRLYFGPKYASDVPLYDNLNNFFQTGYTSRHNLGLEGGNDRSSYRLSVGYTGQQGVVPTTDYKRLSVRLAGNSKITNKLEASTTFNYINTSNTKAGKGAGSTLLALLSWPQTDDARNYTNNDGTRRRLNPNSDTQDIDNPFFDVYKNKNKDQTNRVLGNVTLTYDPLSWLKVQGLVGADIYSTTGNLLFHPQSNRAIATRGSIENYTEISQLLNGQLLVTGKKDFGKISTSLLLGTSFDDRRYNVDAVRGEQFYEVDFNGINNTLPTTQRAKNTLNLIRRQAVFGQFTASYESMLYLTVTGRNDWSSTLPEANNSFFYPSVSGSFVLTELPNLQGGKLISFAKLRASYAEVGKDAPVPYITQSNLLGQVTTGGGLAYNVTGGNGILVPERTSSYEIGADVRLFNGRLGIDAAYFNRKAENQISAPRLSYATGFILQYINSGTIESRGLELLLTGNPIRKANFNWDVTVNFTRNNSVVQSLPAGQSEFYLSDTWMYANVRNSLFPGRPATAFGGNDYLRNTRGDILINPANGYPVKNTSFTEIGDRNPMFTMGLTNSFRYKNFTLSALLDIRRGGDVFNANELFLYANGLSTKTLDRETPRIVKGVLRDGLENSEKPTVNTIQVTPSTRNDFYNTAYVESDFIEHDINWLRLRDVTLRYSFPKSLLGDNKILRGASVFFTGTDLFLLTNYTGADPSINGLNASTGGSGAAGFDYGTVAVPRGYSFGVQIQL
ncbi:SusC/RagA family TonB-linked outer membrane protein [Fibrella forsythiae]|uniref:SusC/RagA family TonB-linked outer membrane protein n=1 Tax=Fibrella forsythiae TaxID=2817061 RepID=A0ABS3JEB6_9BACT|nr:SusC/RagA family TonB-linked outer membrane protein [Fibrella forsythiae]MBO0948322.1 SusC/RagA family TonB-linked outer membrane protein [Fibrella forsythiae]